MNQKLRFLMLALLCAVLNVAWGQTTGTINFGNNGTKITGTSVTGKDDLGNTWTITTVGTTSFTQNTNFSQVGKKDEPAKSITFTTTLSESQSITNFSAKFGGFANTAGTVTLKIGDNTVGTGSLNGTDDVTVSSTSGTTGKVLTVTVTNIERGVKCYYISYTYAGNTNQVATPTFNPVGDTYTTKQDVTISCETVGAKIYYTTDGSDPKNSETKSQYTEAISVTKSGTTIKAYAEKEDMDDSNIASAIYTIKPDNPTITQEGNTVTMTAASGCTIYYNIGTNYQDTNDPTNASTEYTGPIERSESAYFKAIAYDQYGNASGIRSFDFKYSNVIPHPKNINSNYFVKVTSASELEDGDAILIVAENGGSYYAMGGQNNNNRSAVSVSVNDNAIKITHESVQKIVYVDASDINTKCGYFYVGEKGYLYAAASGNNYLRSEEVADANAKAKIEFIEDGVLSVVFYESSNRNVLQYNSSSELFSCYASASQSPVQIYKEVPRPTITATFNPKYKGYTSIYYSDKNLKVPANVTAHTYKVVGGKGEYITNIAAEGIIPAGTPVILEYGGTFANNTDPVEVTFEEVASADPLNDGNMLRGSDQVDANGLTTGPEAGDYYFYVLSVGQGEEAGKIGFYWKVANGAPFAPTPHKAYLALKQSDVPGANASMVSISDTNGINSVSVNNDNAQDVYTLSGIRMNGKDLPKGIYIIGGKKVVVK